MTAAMDSPTMASFTACEPTSRGITSQNGEFISNSDQNMQHFEENEDLADDPTSSPSMRDEFDHDENSNIANTAPHLMNKLRTRAERSFTERPTMLSPGSYDEDFLDMQIAMDSQFVEMTPMTTSDKRRQSRLGKKYMKYTPEDRVAIGKHCFEKGPASARLAFKDKYPNMSESVTRGFREKYKAMIGEVAVFEFEQARREKRANACNSKRKHKNGDGTDKEGLIESTDNNNTDNGADVDPAFLPKKYNKYSPETRMRLGQICAEIGPSATVKRFRDEFPSINGSVVRSFRKKYLASQNNPQVFVLEDGEHGNSMDNNMVSPASNNSAPSMVQPPSSDHIPSMVPQSKRSNQSMPSMVKPDFDDVPSMTKPIHDDSPPSIVRPRSEAGKEPISQAASDDSLPSMSMVRSVREQPLRSYPEDRDQHHLQIIRMSETRDMRVHESVEAKRPRITMPMEEPYPSMISPPEHRSNGPVIMQDDLHYGVKSENGHMVPNQHIKPKEQKQPTAVKSFKNETEFSMARKYEPQRSEPMKYPAQSFQPISDKPIYIKTSEMSVHQQFKPVLYTVNGHERDREKDRIQHGLSPITNGHVTGRPYIFSPDNVHPRQIEADNGQPSPRSDMRPDIRKRVVDARLSDVSDRIDSKHRHENPMSPRSPVYEKRHPLIYSDHRESPTYPYSASSPPYSSTHAIVAGRNHPEYYLREHIKEERDFDDHRAKLEYQPSDIDDKSGQYPYYSPSSDGNSARRREKYQKYTPEDRYNIGKLCDQVGLAATVKVYRESFPRLNESVVRTFRNKYRELVAKSDGASPESETIDRKPSKRSLVGSFESEVCMLLKQYKESGLAVSVNLALAVANQLIVQKGPEYVEKFGGKLELSQEWAYEMIIKRRLNDGPLQAPTSSCCTRCGSGLVCPKCAVHV